MSIDDSITDAALISEAWSVLTRPLERVLGKRSANALAKLGIETVEDLLWHVPFRLTQRGELMAIDAVREGESVTVVARVMESRIRPMNNRRGYILNVKISDSEHDLDLTFFAKHERPLKFHAMQLSPGTIATFSGTISSYRGQLQLAHPEYELIEDETAADVERISQPIPIYHAGAKIPSWQIHKAVVTAFATVKADDFPDPLPADYLREHNLPSKFAALQGLHFPKTVEEFTIAQERMKHEEAFVLQSVLAKRMKLAAEIHAPAAPRMPDRLAAAFDDRLPFDLTAGQREVGAQIADELSRPQPMRRLLQGDVGSGKTLVALRAMLQMVDSGHQAVLIAPTEVLAQQHFDTFHAMLRELAAEGTIDAPEIATHMELLTGSLSAAKKRQTLANIASGRAGIVIGTHALIQDNVQIPFLGLVVVDEQHRFGVDQRDKLARGAHLLVMTATPIPRTIAMTVFGDLRVSTLGELPRGRKDVATTLVPAFNERWMERVWQRAREEIDAGGRVFVVCPRISATEAEADATEAIADDDVLFDTSPQASDREPMASVTEISERLSALPVFRDLQIATLHGRVDAATKDATMRAFAAGERPILVTTTVIEVGVDVSDATLMVILDADRFGLSQLHQLRGRVGRGSKPGLCLAVSQATQGTLAYERLQAFASTTNGFELAELDFSLRREGDVLGSVQSGGSSSLRFLRVSADEEIIQEARAGVRKLMDDDPELRNAPALLRAVRLEDAQHAQYLARG